MAQYAYPLSLQRQPGRIANPSHPVAVVAANGEAIYLGREKLRWFTANSIHVYPAQRAGKNDPDRYQILDAQDRQSDRAYRFVASSSKRVVGKLTQRRQQGTVVVDVYDAGTRPFASTSVELRARFGDVVGAVLGARPTGNSLPPLHFRAGDAPVFTLTPTGLNGDAELTLDAADLSAEREQCVLLAALTMAFWWQHDESAGS